MAGWRQVECRTDRYMPESAETSQKLYSSSYQNVDQVKSACLSLLKIKVSNVSVAGPDIQRKSRVNISFISLVVSVIVASLEDFMNGSGETEEISEASQDGKFCGFTLMHAD